MERLLSLLKRIIQQETSFIEDLSKVILVGPKKIKNEKESKIFGLSNTRSSRFHN